MDLFNKKKIKKLENQIYEMTCEIDRYIKNERNWSKQLDETNEINNKIINENKKLIEWIKNILELYGTMEVHQRNQIQIPICKQNYIAYEGFNKIEEESIIIPEIRIINYRRV